MEKEIEACRRRLREAEAQRDILLHRLMEAVKEVDKYKALIEDAEWSEK